MPSTQVSYLSNLEYIVVNLAKNIQHVLSNLPLIVGGPERLDYIQNSQGHAGAHNAFAGVAHNIHHTTHSAHHFVYHNTYNS